MAYCPRTVIGRRSTRQAMVILWSLRARSPRCTPQNLTLTCRSGPRSVPSIAHPRGLHRRQCPKPYVGVRVRERVVPLRRFRDSASLEARTSSNFSLCSASGWSSHSEFCRVSPLDIFHVQPVHVTRLSSAACWIENQTYARAVISRCINSISGCHSDKTSAPTARLPNARHGKVSETVAATPPICLQRGQRGGSACIHVACLGLRIR